MSFSTCMLFYNKALFDRAGLDTLTTLDWTEAQAAARRSALGDDIWGYYQPVSHNESTVRQGQRREPAQ